MGETRRCPECQGEFRSEDLANGICPGCLLKLALPPPSSLDERAAESGTVAATRGSEAPQHVGPYRILSVLGEGGMGVVYLAEQEPPLRRRVALKVIKIGMDTREVLARFDLERQALAMMNHSSIAQVLDAGTTQQGRPYFAMEYVPGLAAQSADGITWECFKGTVGRARRRHSWRASSEAGHALHCGACHASPGGCETAALTLIPPV